MCPGRVAYYIASYWPTDVDPHTEYWRLPAGNAVKQRLKDVLMRVALGRLRREGYPPKLQFEHVACCSEFVREKLVRAAALPVAAEVVLGGINNESARADRCGVTPAVGQALRLVYFGRLVPDKGVHSAIEALGILRKRRPAASVHLTVLGSGHPDYEAGLQRLAHEHEISAMVDFCGKVPRDEIFCMLPEFDVFLFTSTWDEPFGRTIVEAMQAGLVVVGADVGGSREILRHYDSELLFEPGNACALASRIERILDDPGLCERLGHRGRELVAKRFSMRAMVDGIEAWLSRVAAGQRANAEAANH
jgi:glycosyltransferase involved in cell wall biosynthesis